MAAGPVGKLLASTLALAAPLATLGYDCTATSEAACLSKGGCRWFHYDTTRPCPLCQEWFGDAGPLSGCRSWEVSVYCDGMVYQTALRKFGASPTDSKFQNAITHYRITQGSGEGGNPYKKTAACNVWCELTGDPATAHCRGQPRAVNEVRGVNYGGRFIPEYYLGVPGTNELFWGVRIPQSENGREIRSLSLCDVAEAPDAADRMAKFLDTNIQPEHFQQIANLGFNVVRLPLGYWNLIDLPGSSSPNGIGGARWMKLQNMMKADRYTKWISDVFAYADAAGLKVLLDLHAAPGGQSDESFTGCDQGQGNVAFDTPWNFHLATQAIRKMAMLCGMHGSTCYGLELLNEPASPGGPGSEDGSALDRNKLKSFYLEAIAVARRHVDPGKPIVIMDWPRWLPWWKEAHPFSYEKHGRIIFATHTYHSEPDGATGNMKQARESFGEDFAAINDFHLNSRYEILVSEYALSGHGSGAPDDPFDYSSLANWMVNQFNQIGIGSCVWNYDAGESLSAWGPVSAAAVGQKAVEWRRIFGDPAPETPLQV